MLPVTIYQGNHHVLSPSDINIVIDVIRAFTVAHYAFLEGVKEILLVQTQKEAFLLKEECPEYLLTGEVKGVGIEGFDFDNSPKRITQHQLKGKSLVQKTTNGVNATLRALAARHVFVTGFTNAKTTAEYVRSICGNPNTSVINIVASHPTGDDDLACADYIKGIILDNQSITAPETIARIKNSSVAEKFFDRENPLFDEEDISYCTKEIPGNFVMRVNQERKVPTIERVVR